MAFKIPGLRKNSQSDPKYLWEQFYKAVMRFEWEQALELIRKLKELEPENAQVYMKIGDILQRRGDKNGAIEAYHKAADFMLSVFNTLKALAIYKIILRLNPKDKNAMTRMNEIVSKGDVNRESVSAPKDRVQRATKTKTFVEAFSSHPVFSALSNEDIQNLKEKARRHTFNDGESVIREEETGDSIFLIIKGKASVSSTILEKTYHLATLGQYDFFGEIGFLTGMARTATVAADGPLQVLEIDRDLMNDLIDRNPQVLERLAEISHSRTKNTVEKIKGSEPSHK